MLKVIIRIGFLLVTFWVSQISCYAELIAHWPMDEGTGKVIKDVVGKGGDGTFVGSPKWVDGKYGKALEFSPGNYVIVQGNADLQPTSVTAAMWVYFNDVAPPRQDFFSKNDDYALSLHEWGNDGKIYPILKTGGNWVVKAGTVQIEPKRWYHVALVYNEKTKELLSYIDSKEDAKTSAPAGIEHRGGNLTLGCYNGDRFLKGLLDEVKIWNEPLTQKDLERDMKGPLSVNSYKKLVDCWGNLKTSNLAP